MIIDFQIFEKKWIKKEVPKWFYLVLRLPSGDFEKEKRNFTLDSLMRMEFTQLKGISDHYRISKSFFDIRDSLLIMRGSDVVKLNDIEPIEYFNADSFCKNNFKFWRRITMNEPNFTIYKNTDTSFSSAIRSIFQDLHYTNVKHNKDGGLNFKYFYDKNNVIKYIEESQYEIAEKFSHLYHAGQLHINTLDDFTKVALEMVKDLASKYTKTKGYSWDNWKPVEDYIIEKLTFNELKKILLRAFEYMSKVYEHEGEWSVNSKSFKVPKNSILYFKMEGGEPLPKHNYGTRGLEKKDIDEIVSKYGLEHNYQIKTVHNHLEMMEILKNEYGNDN